MPASPRARTRSPRPLLSRGILGGCPPLRPAVRGVKEERRSSPPPPPAVACPGGAAAAAVLPRSRALRESAPGSQVAALASRGALAGGMRQDP